MTNKKQKQTESKLMNKKETNQHDNNVRKNNKLITSNDNNVIHILFYIRYRGYLALKIGMDIIH